MASYRFGFESPLYTSDCNLLSSVLVTQLCPTLCDPVVCPWISLGKTTRVGCYSLLQEIFPTQESNLVLLHCRQIFTTEPPGKTFYSLGGSKILEKQGGGFCFYLLFLHFLILWGRTVAATLKRHLKMNHIPRAQLSGVILLILMCKIR